jgi:hypothetical protein
MRYARLEAIAHNNIFQGEGAVSLQPQYPRPPLMPIASAYPQQVHSRRIHGETTVAGRIELVLSGRRIDRSISSEKGRL